MVFLVFSSSTTSLSLSLTPSFSIIHPLCPLPLPFFIILHSLHILLLCPFLFLLLLHLLHSCCGSASTFLWKRSKEIQRMKAGNYYVAAIQWNADVHYVPIHPSTSFHPILASQWVRRLQTSSSSLSQTSEIISFLSPSSLQAQGHTLSHRKITPFRHSSHHPVAEVRGQDGVGGSEQRKNILCQRNAALLSTNSLLNSWWDHTVWRFWLASVSVRRWAGRSSHGHCLMMSFCHTGRTVDFFFLNADSVTHFCKWKN